jgi:hypothetical protein
MEVSEDDVRGEELETERLRYYRLINKGEIMIPTFVLWRETGRWEKKRLSMVKSIRLVGGAIWLLPCVMYISRVEYPDPDIFGKLVGEIRWVEIALFW